MANVLIVAYLLIVLALIVVILLQRSEGGALGIGGGGGGGLVSARGSANLMTRTTAVLAALFMATAITLTILADLDRSNERVLAEAAALGEGGNVSDALDALQQGGASDLPIPTDTGLAVPSDGQAVTPDAPVGDAPDLAIPTDTAAPADPAVPVDTAAPADTTAPVEGTAN